MYDWLPDEEFSPDDFSKLMELELLIIVGLILGFFKDRGNAARQKMLNIERLAVIGARALAGVAHDIKSAL